MGRGNVTNLRSKSKSKRLDLAMKMSVQHRLFFPFLTCPPPSLSTKASERHMKHEISRNVRNFWCLYSAAHATFCSDLDLDSGRRRIIQNGKLVATTNNNIRKTRKTELQRCRCGTSVQVNANFTHLPMWMGMQLFIHCTIQKLKPRTETEQILSKN